MIKIRVRLEVLVVAGHDIRILSYVRMRIKIMFRVTYEGVLQKLRYSLITEINISIAAECEKILHNNCNVKQEL